MHEEKRRPGRPRKYAVEEADPHAGAPRLTVRFEPALLRWIKGKGGASWVRSVIERLWREETTEA